MIALIKHIGVTYILLDGPETLAYNYLTRSFCVLEYAHAVLEPTAPVHVPPPGRRTVLLPGGGGGRVHATSTQQRTNLASVAIITDWSLPAATAAAIHDHCLEECISESRLAQAAFC